MIPLPTELYAVIRTDLGPEGDNFGIVAAWDEEGRLWMPMVTPLERIVPKMVRYARTAGTPFRVVKFTNPEDVTAIFSP